MYLEAWQKVLCHDQTSFGEFEHLSLHFLWAAQGGHLQNMILPSSGGHGAKSWDATKGSWPRLLSDYTERKAFWNPLQCPTHSEDSINKSSVFYYIVPKGLFSQMPFQALMPIKTKVSMTSRSSHPQLIRPKVPLSSVWTQSYSAISDCDLLLSSFSLFLFFFLKNHFDRSSYTFKRKHWWDSSFLCLFFSRRFLKHKKFDKSSPSCFTLAHGYEELTIYKWLSCWGELLFHCFYYNKN